MKSSLGDDGGGGAGGPPTRGECWEEPSEEAGDGCGDTGHGWWLRRRRLRIIRNLRNLHVQRLNLNSRQDYLDFLVRIFFKKFLRLLVVFHSTTMNFWKFNHDLLHLSRLLSWMLLWFFLFTRLLAISMYRFHLPTLPKRWRDEIVSLDTSIAEKHC